MRNAGRIFCDPAVVSEHRNRLYILVTRRAKCQPFGLEDGNTAFALRRCADIFRESHFRAPAKKTERGSRHPGLPLSEPIGPAGSTGCRRTSYDPPYYWAAASVIGSTETNTRPLVLVWNSTRPLINANKVWSRPMPTLRPACHLVPRWRAMMLPATTCSPPKIFMPKRWPAESRPLREDPPAFL